MANALYDKGREKFLNGAISWGTHTIKAVLVDTGIYTVNLSAHEFLSDLSGVVGTAAVLTGKTYTAGVADADDVTLASVTGNSAEAIVLYRDTGAAGTSPLIAYIDTAAGLPVTPNGGDITIVWDGGASRIFKL